MSGAILELTEDRRRALTRLLTAWRLHHAGPGSGEAPVDVRQVEVLRAGRPGLIDVLAEVNGVTAHAVFGLRRPGQEAHFLRSGEEPIVGLLDDDEGLGVAVDALRDGELAGLVLSVVTGDPPADDSVALVGEEPEGVVLSFGERCTMTVFPFLTAGPHPGIELLVALDDAGFNHLAAPLALWRREGRDLGVVQEFLAGQAGGFAVALTSLRDLYATGGPPEDAGGDFAPEARALGTMTARMHLALDQAFGREAASVAAWVDEAEARVAAADPSLLDEPDVAPTLASLRSAGLRAVALRTHGDFHLGRTARTDQGWVVADCLPGGVADGNGPAHRSPLHDVADLLWSFHHVATVAAQERDPTGRSGLASLARAWETRNRRAFLTGYLATPGILGLVPPDKEVVADLAAVFELERAASRAPARERS
ncbi:MAG TPA: hypothetical protein VK277_11290 [Acidimicrobiales bacterium]|nr:hypothetical protein [Acidimicrobiales bacterium]